MIPTEIGEIEVCATMPGGGTVTLEARLRVQDEEGLTLGRQRT